MPPPCTPQSANFCANRHRCTKHCVYFHTDARCLDKLAVPHPAHPVICSATAPPALIMSPTVGAVYMLWWYGKGPKKQFISQQMRLCKPFNQGSCWQGVQIHRRSEAWCDHFAAPTICRRHSTERTSGRAVHALGSQTACKTAEAINQLQNRD